jgi:uncharacterized integral membrane protein
MSLYKRTFFSIIFNITLFLILIIGIQNSSRKSKVNLIINETINLPISFIVGISFLSGSVLGSFASLNSFKKK